MSAASICARLRRNPRDPDIVRQLRRLFELLQDYDLTGDTDSLGAISMMEVGYEMLFIASKIEHAEMERFISQTSGMAELLFQWDAHSPAAERAARMDFLGEEAPQDAEYAMFRAEQGFEASKQFLPYITTLLAVCAGLPVLQIKAVSRLIHLALDPIVWLAGPLGLMSAFTTLAAMANPKSSFRDEFQRMGGLAVVGQCYLEDDEPERLNVFTQSLRNVIPQELRVNLNATTMQSFLKLLVLNCFDVETPDRDEHLVPHLFACLFDSAVFRNHFDSWLNVSYFRKDCPSAFLRFVHLKSAEISSQFPHANRHDLGLLLAWAFTENDNVKKIYQWSTYPETRKSLWRTSEAAQVFIAQAEAAQATLGRELIDWTALAKSRSLQLDNCMVCQLATGKLQRCGACRNRWYCSKQCQSRDWSQRKHKEECSKM